MASADETFLRDLSLGSDLALAPSGDLGLVSGIPNLRAALFRRLVTVPGTLVHRPTYGVGLKEYQSAPNSLSLQKRIATLIREQFLQDPRVEDVTTIRFESADLTPDKLTITVSIKPIGYQETEMQFTPFSEGV